jgi:putative endonuclease
VYILSNSHHTAFYTGVTNDLIVRCYQHKNKLNKGFTAKYNIDQLIYFELFDQVDLAIKREKQKGYSRAKKLALLKSINPEMVNLFVDGVIKLPNP